MNLATINIAAILPPLVLSLFGIGVMVAEPFVNQQRKSNLGWLAFAGTLAAILSLIPMADNRGQWYSNLWIVDDYDVFLDFIFLLIAAITILTSIDFLRREWLLRPTSRLSSINSRKAAGGNGPGSRFCSRPSRLCFIAFFLRKAVRAAFVVYRVPKELSRRRSPANWRGEMDSARR